MLEELKSKIKAYLKLKDIETAKKKRAEKINAIVKGLLVDKSPKQAIEMLSDVIELLNDRLDEKLKESLENVECITKYKNL